MKYTNNMQTIIDLREFALKHMGDEEENCSKWDKAENLIDVTIKAIRSEEVRDIEDTLYKNLRINRMQTIKEHLGDLIGYEVVEIEIEGFKCITKRQYNEDKREICEKVYPFDENRKYPIQEIEAVYTFKRYY